MRFVKAALVLLSATAMPGVSSVRAQMPQRGATTPAPARGATPARAAHRHPPPSRLWGS